MPLIAVGHGKFAVVDDEDWGYLTVTFGAWCLNKGYPFTAKGFGPRKRTWWMHREIGRRMGLNPSLDVDHENTDTLNCRRDNLREATKGQNLMNSRLKSNSQSGIKGVKYDKRRGTYQVRIQVDGVRHHIGSFETAEEADLARQAAADKYHGEFARYS